jgi:hypothetical protein
VALLKDTKPGTGSESLSTRTWKGIPAASKENNEKAKRWLKKKNFNGFNKLV